MSQQGSMSDLDQDVETVVLPLFPLRLVLFPGQVLPLHVFEPCVSGDDQPVRRRAVAFRRGVDARRHAGLA